MEAVRRRQEAEVLELCADAQEKLAKAKAGYRENPNEETRAAVDAAMEEMHTLRRWLREGGRPAVADHGSAVVGDRPPARRRRGR